jgi:hypothetical protein
LASVQYADEDRCPAAAFFVGVNVVKQRLRLAAVSEKLLDVYAECVSAWKSDPLRRGIGVQN